LATLHRQPGGFRGLIAAPHTPLRPDFSLNLAAVESQAAHLLRWGVQAAFIGGSTGEGPSLTQDERGQLTRRWTEVARGTPLRVVVHVGSNCQPDARALAMQAQACGAAAISAMAPFYFRPRSVEDLVAHCAAIADAAPALPFYYYDYPAMTGVELPMREFLEQAAVRIPTLAGMKYSTGALARIQECLTAAGGRFNVLMGCDELLLAGWALGVRGAVGTTFNVAAPLYHEILAAFENGQMTAARRKQSEAAGLVGTLARYGLIAASKAMMGMLGVDCGPVRPPLRNLTRADLRRLRKDLARGECWRRLR
jgi:N-acetylneuraminate lyase